MKRTLLFIALILLTTSANAHLVRWLLPPTQDSIMIKVDKKIFVSDSLGWSALWDMDGKRLFKTNDSILPFQEGVATTLDKDGKITGFVDLDGNFTKLPDLEVAYDNPYFNDGFLIFKDGDSYGYYKINGEKAFFPTNIKTYPFKNGYTQYLSYEQPDKRKDPHFTYYDASGNLVMPLVLNNGTYKSVDPKDVVFLSAIGDDGKSVGVIKNKLYWFNSRKKVFDPLLWGDDESEKKRHLTLEGDYTYFYNNLNSDTIVITAKFGKKQSAELRFDNQLRPIDYTFDGEVVKFEQTISDPEKYITRLSKYQDTVNYEPLWGLSFINQNVLPAQFEGIDLMYGDRAIVKKDGKWGIIEIIPGADFNLSINQGENIAFRHQKYNTQIKIDLPVSVPAEEVRMDIPQSSGCIIDKISRNTRNTEYGNYVTYDCCLIIPEALPDTLTTISYKPISVTIDNIKMFDKGVDVKAWHYKSYNVDPIDSETTIDNGVASFTVNINIQRNVGEKDYPFEIILETDSTLTATYEKISETRYKCTVYDLKEGSNSINIHVVEEGCPPSIFPFEMTYTKPEKKQKEAVVVRKKSPAETKKASNTLIKMEL